MRKIVYRAFTLVELLMCIAIIGILSAILLSRYPDSAVRINLLNISHSITLLIQEAQVRGAAVDSANSTVAGYGVYFTTTASTSAILFADTITATQRNGIYIGDGLYTTTPLDETRSTTILPSRYSIQKLCTGTGYPFTCGASSTPPITTLTITFIRPNPEPLIYINDSTSLNQPIAGACIELWSPYAPSAGHVRSVRVLGAGLITSSNQACN